MSKYKPTPKEIMKKRLQSNKLLKLGKPKCDQNDIKEPIMKKSTTYPPRHKEIKDCPASNPFAVQQHLRLFTKSRPSLKKRPDPIISDDLHTICDVYNLFYKSVESRPLKVLDDVKVYILNIKDVLRFRTYIGFVKDEVQRIDQKYTDELQQFEKIRRLYVTCRTTFILFLKLSFAHVKFIQEKAAELAVELDEMSDKLEDYNFQYVRVRNGLGGAIGKYEILLKYKTFFTSISPKSWQKQNGVQDDAKASEICASITNAIEDNSIVDKDSGISIKDNARSLASFQPWMYFNEPRDLISYYDALSRQGQYYMEIVNDTFKILTCVRERRKSFETKLNSGFEDTLVDIAIWEKSIKYIEDKERAYKNAFHRVLFNDFHRLYGDFENIKLHTCVQYVHTRIFGGPEDFKDNITTMMRSIECLYLDLALKLDCLDLQTVKTTTEQIFSEDIKIISEAYHAQHKLQTYDKFHKKMYTSFEPPRKTHIQRKVKSSHLHLGKILRT